MSDASNRKRLRFGSQNKKSKLTEENVIDIRNEYPKKSTIQLSKEYGVKPSNIRHAIIGKTWKHLPGAKKLNRFNRANGERMGRSKLTEKQVKEIRGKYPSINGPQLAKEYGISHRNVYCIVKHKNWTHI